jgi:hypothetical protein
MRAKVVFPLALGAMGALASSNTAAAPPRNPDEKEIQEMRAKSPHAVELLERGDALAAAGSAQEAEALFRQARTEFPNASILWRKDCEMLIALGKRDEAVSACASALGQAHWGANFRGLVSAFLDGPGPTTFADLARAVRATASERHKGPSFSIAAAACDIAERIGDDVMLQRCAEELKRYDANDPATKKALSVLASRCPPWRFWGGWGAIAAAIAATLVHAVLRFVRRRAPRAGVAAAAAMALTFCALPRIAAADTKPGFHGLSKWAIDDDHPEANIPSEKERNADPLQFGYWLQDVALKGEHASRRGDHLAAARFYEALGKAVPERATGFVKACEEYEAAGDRKKAIDMCADALVREGLTVKDYTRFVHLVLQEPEPLSENQKSALVNVLAHMREDPAGHAVVDDLECEVGTRLSKVALLKECTAGLVQSAPNAPKTVMYLWALAVADSRIGEAGKLIERAQAAGVGAEDIERMKKTTAAKATQRNLRYGLFAFAVGLFLAGVVVAFRAILARKRPGAQPPAAAGAGSESTSAETANAETANAETAAEPSAEVQPQG